MPQSLAFGDILRHVRRICTTKEIPNAEIATIGVLRQALVIITELASTLQPAASATDLDQLWMNRRAFLMLVPRIQTLYDATARLLETKGATSSSVAGKLANQAYQVSEAVIAVTQRVNLAAEYNELSREIIPGILQALSSPMSEQTQTTADPFKQSMEVLKLRIQVYAEDCEPVLGRESIERLERQAQDLGARIEELAIQSKQPAADRSLRDLAVGPSPARPVLALLRGVRLRQASVLRPEQHPSPMKLLVDNDSNKENSHWRIQPQLSSPEVCRYYGSRIRIPARIENGHVIHPIEPLPGAPIKICRPLKSRIVAPTPIEKLRQRHGAYFALHGLPDPFDPSPAPLASRKELPRLEPVLASPNPWDTIDTPIPLRRQRRHGVILA